VNVADPAKKPLTYARAAHILSTSINKNHRKGNDKVCQAILKTVDHMQQTHAVMAWTIMQHFGGVKVEDELNGSRMHRLENIITVDINYHHFF
jgi:hypothetical protein